jgi:protein-tyrosine phosphatase
MFSFFKKKVIVDHMEWLGVDIHSHLLPGIDDGSPDVATSVKLISHLNGLGFSKFICTPHIFTELYPNNRETINAALTETKNALIEAGLTIEISAAAEHMVDETFNVSPDLMCLPGKYILIEMSYLSENPNIEQVIFDLQLQGYFVILAHPERYTFYHNNYPRFNRLKDMGVLFQLNLLSLSGYYGKGVKHAAEYLIENRIYDVAATDLHHERHLKVLDQMVKSGKLYQQIGTYDFKNKALFG